MTNNDPLVMLVNNYLQSIYGSYYEPIPRDADPHSYFLSKYDFVRVLDRKFVDSMFPSVLNSHLPCPFFKYLSKENILQGESVQLGDFIGPFSCGFATWACPIDSFQINKHNPASLGRNITCVPDYTNVEITHVCCDSPQIGSWVSVVKGSGIYYNVGKSLASFNKVDAAIKLGNSPRALAQSFPDFSWNGWGPTSWSKEKEYIANTFHISSLEELLIAVASGERNNTAIDFISDCPVLDELNYSSARAQGYDSIQMCSAGYQGGYWSFEIQDTRSSDILDLVDNYIITVSGGKKCNTLYPMQKELLCQNISCPTPPIPTPISTPPISTPPISTPRHNYLPILLILITVLTLSLLYIYV